jgi:hypothetical protein
MGPGIRHLTIMVHGNMGLRRSRDNVSLCITMGHNRAVRHSGGSATVGGLGIHNEVLKRSHIRVHLGPSKNTKDGRLGRTLTLSPPGRINHMEIRVVKFGHCSSSNFHLLRHSITKRYILFPGN